MATNATEADDPPKAAESPKAGSMFSRRASRISIMYEPASDPFEMPYPAWFSFHRTLTCFKNLTDHTLWNIHLCGLALAALVSAIDPEDLLLVTALATYYNVVYFVNTASALCLAKQEEHRPRSIMVDLGLDMVTYVFILNYDVMMICYFLRLHRPLRYLWNLNDYNLKGSILGTALKYVYISLVLRITLAIIWLVDDVLKNDRVKNSQTAINMSLVPLSSLDNNPNMSAFIRAFYCIDKIFLPIGPSLVPLSDWSRLFTLAGMLGGCLSVSGAAVASLCSVISVYLSAEEGFRTRFRLIMKEIKESHVPLGLREKVETFYQMYWRKQRAVSTAALLPTFPPSLSAMVHMDIYFEAMQKSRILRNLSYQFLSELAKKMVTIHYIPGDAIIKRNTKKSSIIFVTYGDIEMLTAEDDLTAILRMTRGTILSGGGGVPPSACPRAAVQVRAATFCTAHALSAPDLWHLVVKRGRRTGEGEVVLSDYYDHFENVRRHYTYVRIPDNAKHKSSINHFKRNLMALKEAVDNSGQLLLGRTDVFLEVAGCYVMRNRTDTALTDEADAICLRPTFPCILQPASSLQCAWSVLVTCLVLLVSITHPYYMVFMRKIPLEFRIFDYVLSGVFVLDIFVHLSTGANVEEGVAITFVQTSAQQIRSGWFVLDVAAVLPMLEFIGDGHFAGMNKLLKIPKVFRVLKNVEETFVYHSNVIRFLSYTLLVLVMCYQIAALQQYFMCFHIGHCSVIDFTQKPYWTESRENGDELENRLIFSQFWTLSLITFTTHMETWEEGDFSEAGIFVVFLLEIALVLHIFIEAFYSATIMLTTALKEDYDSCIKSVKDFLVRSHVDSTLRQRFIVYLQLCWHTDKAFAMTHKKSIFHDLPPHVYQDIVTRQRSKYILSIPFMKLFQKEDLKNIATKARLFYTSPNEVILNTGDISNEMYVIKQGYCEMLDPDTQEVVGALGIKRHFGVLECLLRIPAYYTIRAVTHVQVFSISRKNLVQAIEIVPHIRDAIQFAKEQPEYSALQVKREPFVFYEAPEATPNRRYFRLPRKHEPDHEFMQPFKRMGTFSVLRYVFPRFTIRPDGRYLARYEWLRASCAFLTAMLVPGYAYLVLEWPSLYYVVALLDLAAYADICLRMLVGYFNERGVLVSHPASTAAYYLKGAFFVDLFACLPLEYLESPTQEMMRNRYRVTPMEQYMMLPRLLQLYRLPSAMQMLSDHIEREDVLLVLKSLPLFMALLNTLTCFMVLHSANIYFSTEVKGYLIQPFSDPGGSWMRKNTSLRFNVTENTWNLHLACYFWVVYEATTTGYNSLQPTSISQMLILFLTILLGSMATTYVGVRIISIRVKVNKTLVGYKEHLKDLTVYMQRESVEKKLQHEILDHFEYNWNKTGGMDYRNVLKLCDQITLRTDTILQLYGHTFAKCPILAGCDISLLRLLGRAVHSLYFLEHTTISLEDDVLSDMYFIDYGSVTARKGQDHGDTGIYLGKGSVFGNLKGVASIKCPMTFVAASKVHLLQINSVAFIDTTNEFPVVSSWMEKFRVISEFYVMGQTTNASIQDLKALDEDWSHSAVHKCYTSDAGQLYLITIALSCIFADIYNAGFQVNSIPLLTTLYALDVAFFLKIVVHYMLPYLVANEEHRNVLSKNRTKYIKSEFAYDALSCLPLEMYSFVVDKDGWLAFSLLRLNRLLRIVTVYKCVMRHRSRLRANLTRSAIVAVTIWCSLSLHIASAMWNLIGLLEDRTSPKSSWRYKDDGEAWCNSQYMCSLYFVFTTFTQNGVGDIMPKQESEVIYTSILMIISIMLYMVYVGEFANIIQYQSFRAFSFYGKFLELLEFLHNRRVSPALVAMVKRYTLHLWRESRGHQLPEFLVYAPPCIKLKLMAAAYLDHFTSNVLFKDCEPAFLRQLVGCLQLYTYCADMYVVKEGQVLDAMHIIHTGRVEEVFEGVDVVPKVYSIGQSFGEMHSLKQDIPYEFSYRTLIKCQILSLRFKDLKQLLAHYPNSRNEIYKFVRDLDDDDGHDSDKQKSKRIKIKKSYDSKSADDRLGTSQDSAFQASGQQSTNSCPINSRSPTVSVQLNDDTIEISEEDIIKLCSDSFKSKSDLRNDTNSEVAKKYLKSDFTDVASAIFEKFRRATGIELNEDEKILSPAELSKESLAGHEEELSKNAVETFETKVTEILDTYQQTEGSQIFIQLDKQDSPIENHDLLQQTENVAKSSKKEVSTNSDYQSHQQTNETKRVPKTDSYTEYDGTHDVYQQTDLKVLKGVGVFDNTAQDTKNSDVDTTLNDKKGAQINDNIISILEPELNEDIDLDEPQPSTSNPHTRRQTHVRYEDQDSTSDDVIAEQPKFEYPAKKTASDTHLPTTNQKTNSGDKNNESDDNDRPEKQRRSSK